MKNSNLKSKIKTNIIIIVITLLIIITFFYCIYYSEHNGQISQSTGVITCKEYIKDNEYIKMYFTADNFLYNMARILAGTMVLCGQNKLSENDINNLLKIEDRSKNPAITMQEKGLKLFDIKLKNMPKY